MNDREFVLEAEQITFKYGRFIYVNANTNFVSMHGDKATIQMAFNSPYAGPNGIGGITVDGTASNVKNGNRQERQYYFYNECDGRRRICHSNYSDAQWHQPMHCNNKSEL